MSVGWVLLDVEGRLRAGWRLLLHVVILAAVLFGTILFVVGLVTKLDQLGYIPPDPLLGLLTQSFVGGTALIVATAASAWVLETRWPLPSQLGRLADSGHSTRVGRGLFEAVAGVVIASVAMGITVGGMALGGMSMSVPGMDLTDLAWWLVTLLALVFAAWMEELLFRGYLYQWIGGSLSRLGIWMLGGKHGLVAGLVDTVAFAGPALLLSVAFGLLHLSNPSATWLSTVNTALAGVWFTVLLLRTRSLWPAIVAHWFWNALTILILGLPVSGVGESSGFFIPSLIRLEATGPDWLSGAQYGPEGSVACIAGLVVAILLSAVLPRRRPEHGFSAARRLPLNDTPPGGPHDLEPV